MTGKRSAANATAAGNGRRGLPGAVRCGSIPAVPGSVAITAVEQIPITDWQGPFAEIIVRSALRSLESGKVLHFPALPYAPEPSDPGLFSPQLTDNRSKNISYDAERDVLKGTAATDTERGRLKMMMTAFSATARQFIAELFPAYVGHIEPARASYRPVEITGRDYSPLKDDRLLHVDAFPSTPMRGRRILRLFCNIDPGNKPRVWHIGEPFQEFAERFLPTLARPAAPIAWLLAAIGATRGRRSAYDQLMLALHDGAKRDAGYQQNAPHEEIAFPAGSTWLCFTDQVLHAAIAGQYALEQTFYLDVDAMADPVNSPVRILERITRRQLC